MISIVNTDEKWGIGEKGHLQTYLSDDLKRFKKMTVGKVIIYGSNTLRTFPKGEPLPQRRNIILSRNREFQVDNALMVRSLPDLFRKIEELKAEFSYLDEDFIVVGGASVYHLLLDYCTDCYVTRMHKVFPADVYFPDLDALANWELIERSEKKIDSKTEIEFSYLHYIQNLI